MITRTPNQAEFTDIDFAVLCPTPTPSVRPHFYYELQCSGVQAYVTQDCSTISLVNVVKAARGSVKIYAGMMPAPRDLLLVFIESVHVVK